MEKKIKIGLTILFIGIAVISGWFIWYNYRTPASMYQDVIPSIISASEIEKFDNLKVNAIGFLNCSKSKVPCKIKFYDGTTLALSTNISDKEYNNQLVEIMGRVYRCKFPDQCHDIVLTNPTIGRMKELEKYTSNSSYCERGDECVVWCTQNCPYACNSQMASPCRYSINFLSKPINLNDSYLPYRLGGCRDNKCAIQE